MGQGKKEGGTGLVVISEHDTCPNIWYIGHAFSKYNIVNSQQSIRLNNKVSYLGYGECTTSFQILISASHGRHILSASCLGVRLPRSEVTP